MIPGADPADALKQISREIQEKFRESGMSRVEEFTDKIDSILDTLKTGPQKLLTDSRLALAEFDKNLSNFQNNPASLAPDGGMAACASWYGSSVAAKLGAVKSEVNDLSASMSKMSEDLKGPLSNLETTLSSSMTKLETSLKALAKLPKQVSGEMAKVKGADDVAKINVDPLKKAVEGGDVDGPLNAIAGLKSELGDTVAVAKQGIQTLKDFIANAPDSIKAAFDVPPPLCFLTGALLAQAPQAMTTLLKVVDSLGQIDLQPLIDMLENVTQAVGNIDVGAVKEPVSKFTESAKSLVGQLETVVQGAALSSNPIIAGLPPVPSPFF
eukprot:TRINITY_DN37502_c0_g1_i1.p1 TRINITY_DN37502_c0_g1~~TRINITY_DN37502_c0_g1_i1.p1  ORF type:complete len:326 (+),score=76.02 TRINITY_DN37502_c0_g1_i1:267-1244(+)